MDKQIMEYFEFVETPTFVRQREGLLDDDTFQQLQEYLIRLYQFFITKI
jgi:hypothetical protein